MDSFLNLANIHYRTERILKVFLLNILSLLISSSIFSLSAIASPNKTLDIQIHISSAPLGKYLDTYIDSSGKLVIEDLLKLNDEEWQNINKSIPSFGHKKAALWFHLKIQNKSTSEIQRLLSLELPTIDHYRVFITKEKSLVEKFILGDSLPFNQRAIDSYNFVSPITIKADEVLSVYFRIESAESVRVPIYLRDNENHNQHEKNTLLLYGMYFGALLIMAFYNLALFISIKDKSYLYFTFYILSATLYRFSASGLGFKYIWPTLPSINGLLILVFVSMIIFSVSLFIYSFMQISKSHKLYYYILRTQMFVSLFIPVLGLSNLHLAGVFVNLLALFTTITAIWITISRYLDNLRYAKPLIVGLLILLMSTLMLILNRLGFLPANFLTENSSQIGYVLTILLMSMSLSQRIKHNHNKRILAEQKALTVEKNIRLEKEKYLKLKITAKEEEIQAKEDVFIARDESKAKSDFLATMSHEIRTPMNGVLGIAEILSDTELDPQQRYYINVIQESGNTLLNIINDILDFSKIEAGKIELEMIDFELNQLCQQCISNFIILAKNKNIDLVVSIKPGTLIYLKSDPTRLKQIILNLLSNAFKFTRSGSIILRVTSIASEEDSNSSLLKFQVIDTGIGISDSQKKKLFSEFSQADSSTTRKYGGTGLGLAICKQLSELLGGEIGVDSEENVGTTFWFTCKVTEASKNFVSENSIPTVSLENKNILFVDDSPAFIDTAKEVAIAWGMNVEVAFSAEEALEKLYSSYNNKVTFDIISLDMAMPGKTGLECAEIINENPNFNSSKVLLLTAMDVLPEKQDLIKAGIDKAAQKPASANFLLEIFLELIDGKNIIEKQEIKKSKAYLEHKRKLSGKTILVAEDNTTNQIVINKMLLKIGVNPVLVTDGEQAYQFAKEQHTKIDCILMDCEMPVMDGYQATKLIREWEDEQKLGQLPIIALTAHALAEHRKKALDFGINYHLVKPVNIKSLSETLAKMIAS